MRPMASQITSLTIVYSTVYSDADQRKHQSSASLAFVWGIHPHKGPVTRKMFPFDDVIMFLGQALLLETDYWQRRLSSIPISLLVSRHNGWDFHRQTPFWIEFSRKKVLYLLSIHFSLIVSRGSNWRELSIVSSNDLVLNRQLTFTLTNDDPAPWLMYASPSLDSIRAVSVE